MPENVRCASIYNYSSRGPTQGRPSTMEDTMDKIWLYVGGIILGAAALIFFAISVVSKTHPPESDLRAAYEKTK
jgi:hypothetical protein